MGFWYTNNVPKSSAIKIKYVDVRHYSTVVEQYISIRKMIQAFNSSEIDNKVLIYVSWGVDLIYESHKWKYSIVLSLLSCLVKNDLIHVKNNNFILCISWDECCGFYKRTLVGEQNGSYRASNVLFKFPKITSSLASKNLKTAVFLIPTQMDLHVHFSRFHVDLRCWMTGFSGVFEIFKRKNILSVGIFFTIKYLLINGNKFRGKNPSSCN